LGVKEKRGKGKRMACGKRGGIGKIRPSRGMKAVPGRKEGASGGRGGDKCFQEGVS